MKVIYVDDTTPRVDHQKGKPMNMTLMKEYEVLEVDGFFYVVINDKGKRARYISQRFKKSSEFNREWK
ncbi:hypothetical protein N9937_00270 [bacterium]|nr:hypothetical protein [bacterium]